MTKLSIIIPSYRDPLLIKTIDSLLTNSVLNIGELEIIAVIDGYEPTFELKQDPRVKYIKLGKNRGMRGAINAGVDIAKGEFFMRLDEHCCFGKGYDKILTDACQPNEIMTARRFFLDPVKWEVMQDKGYVDYERLDIQNISEGVRKFAGRPWKERDEKRKDVMVDETQAMQGSMWIAPLKWFREVVGELDTEHYGPLIQDSVEVCMKTWQAGGRLMLNKNTWFAHKHRDFPRTHNNGSPENPAQNEKGYKYALDTWEKYYLEVLVPRWAEWEK
jgi:glycosyltransferase involved in cell wall biosynthesis